MIEKMKEEDYPRVWEIWLKEVKRAHLCICDKFWDSRLATMINETKNADEKYVYKKNGQVVGFITARKDGYILELYVESRFQRQCVGTQLLKKLKEKHTTCLNVSVYKHNINAVKWYEKQGFEKETDQCKPCSLTGFEKYTMKWRENKRNGSNCKPSG